MITEPHITVIMPCFNAARTIPGAIASIQNQSLTDWELIVVDDGSSDDSAAIVQGINEPRLRLFTQANQGPASARNQGLRNAAGRFIAFLDSDDAWHPGFLETMLLALEPHHDAVLAYCGWQNLGIEGGRGKPFIPPDYEALDRTEVLLGGCRWPIHAVLLRRDAIEQSGGFDESLPSSEDYDLWLRIAPQGRLIRVPEVLAYYHHHEGTQITKNRFGAALNHWRAQIKYLEQHPDEAKNLGRKRLRELVWGELLRRAYICYWNRDLPAARALFRMVMRAGYGHLKDWRYMLPALLPQSVHAWFLRKRDMSTP